jgi:hypothetical protein
MEARTVNNLAPARSRAGSAYPPKLTVIADIQCRQFGDLQTHAAAASVSSPKFAPAGCSTNSRPATCWS